VTDNLPLPVPPYAVVVYGDRGRITYVDTRPGAVIQPWIEVTTEADGTVVFRDTGAGTLVGEDSVQVLPDLVSTAPAVRRDVPAWAWVAMGFLALIGALALSQGGSGRAQEW